MKNAEPSFVRYVKGHDVNNKSNRLLLSSARWISQHSFSSSFRDNDVHRIFHTFLDVLNPIMEKLPINSMKN